MRWTIFPARTRPPWPGPRTGRARRPSTPGRMCRRASVVAADGAVTDGPYPEAIGGFTLVEVASREEALGWAARIAVACRCAQEVREIGADPELVAMLRQADSRR